MNLSDFLKILYKYYGNERNTVDFVRSLFAATVNKEKGNVLASGWNKLTLKKVYNGQIHIPKQLAENIILNLSYDNFKSFTEISTEALINVYNELSLDKSLIAAEIDCMDSMQHSIFEILVWFLKNPGKEKGINHSIKSRIDISEDSNADTIHNIQNDMIDWWIGTVFFAFFPIMVAIMISFFSTNSVDFQRMIGDGELILASFAVIIPSLIGQYNGKAIKRINKKLFYSSLISAFFQLIVYTSIKINNNNNASVVYLTSGICVLSTIFIAWQCEKNFKGESK